MSKVKLSEGNILLLALYIIVFCKKTRQSKECLRSLKDRTEQYLVKKRMLKTVSKIIAEVKR